MKRFSPNTIILILCILAFATTAAVAYFAFERLPHLEDEVAYLFQARTMALGRLTVPSPEPKQAFWTPFVLDHQGQRFGKYPPGWPSILAAGVLAGLPWLVNPLLAALSLYLIYRLGKTIESVTYTAEGITNRYSGTYDAMWDQTGTITNTVGIFKFRLGGHYYRVEDVQ